MTNSESSKGRSSKLSRSETVTVRFAPKWRYLADLAARKHRRSLSSYIEWAVEESLKQVILTNEYDDRSLFDAAFRLWDVDEADRFVKLAFFYPELLTHDEQILWKVIREYNCLWKCHLDDEDPEDPGWALVESNINYDYLRLCWETLKRVATLELPRSALLPLWEKYRKEALKHFEYLDN